MPKALRFTLSTKITTGLIQALQGRILFRFYPGFNLQHKGVRHFMDNKLLIIMVIIVF